MYRLNFLDFFMEYIYIYIEINTKLKLTLLKTFIEISQYKILVFMVYDKQKQNSVLLHMGSKKNPFTEIKHQSK